MWVFGYGSLMWDGWQDKHGCLRRVVADLPGYVRVLTKASTRNWGSKRNPGPTLNISLSANGFCRGIAFEFPADRQRAVIDNLTEREGGFQLSQLTIHLRDGSEFLATTPIYSREQNLLHGKSPGELAALAFAAQGTSGRCSDYVRNVAAQLAELSLVDENILAVVRELDRLTSPSSR